MKIDALLQKLSCFDGRRLPDDAPRRGLFVVDLSCLIGEPRPDIIGVLSDMPRDPPHQIHRLCEDRIRPGRKSHGVGFRRRRRD